MNNNSTVPPDLDDKFSEWLQRVVSEAVTNVFKDVKKSEPILLDEKEAAQFFGLRPQTLALWRHQSRGPAYHKLGSSIRYDFQELRTYLHNQRVK